MNTNTVAVWVEMEARPGKADELEELLKAAAPIAQNEPETVTWFAMRLSETRFCIFDTFSGEDGRRRHLEGDLPKRLTEKQGELLVNPVTMQEIAVLAAKI
jgi:quinol monooxygenase YgiN